MPEQEFRQLVARSLGIGFVLAPFGLENKGRNHYTARQRINELGIDTSHFNNKRQVRPSVPPIPLEKILTVGFRYSVFKLKARLIKAGLLQNICAGCGLLPHWNGSPLSLQLDHINGDNLDNRIENLRILCPNCHSQQVTFAGKQRRKDFGARSLVNGCLS